MPNVKLAIDDISDLPASERQRLLDEVGGEHSVTAQRESFCKILVDATRLVCPIFNEADHVRSTIFEHVKWGLFGDAVGVRDRA